MVILAVKTRNSENLVNVIVYEIIHVKYEVNSIIKKGNNLMEEENYLTGITQFNSYALFSAWSLMRKMKIIKRK